MTDTMKNKITITRDEFRQIIRDASFTAFNEIIAGAKTTDDVEKEADNLFNYYWKKHEGQVLKRKTTNI